MPIDHLLIAADDLAAVAGRLEREAGLVAQPGGAHPGWGTGNWIVPLGTSYLELVGIEDSQVAATNVFGRALLAALAAGGGLYAWCVQPVDFSRTVARLGLEPASGSRHRPDGAVLRWRTAGLENAMADPSRPFFIEWRVPGDLHPGHVPDGRRSATIRRLEVAGEPQDIESWLGDEDDVPILVTRGSAALIAVVLDIAGRELRLTAANSA